MAIEYSGAQFLLETDVLSVEDPQKATISIHDPNVVQAIRGRMTNEPGAILLWSCSGDSSESAYPTPPRAIIGTGSCIGAGHLRAEPE